MSSKTLARGEGRRLLLRDNPIALKAVGADTSDLFSVLEREVPPGGRTPRPHRHPATHEAFYVLDGELEFLLDGARVPAGSGAFVLVPPGAAHTFANRGAGAARVLVLHAPAMDRYFDEIAALSARGLDPSAELELMRRHGIEPA